MLAMFRHALQMPLPDEGQPADGAQEVPAEPQETETIEPPLTSSIIILPEN